MADGEHPVAYLSKKLLPREQNYSYYLDGRKFIIETDHNPLTWVNKMKDKNQRLLRWALALQTYTFEVKYRKGSQNGNADGLSRFC